MNSLLVDDSAPEKEQQKEVEPNNFFIDDDVDEGCKSEQMSYGHSHGDMRKEAQKEEDDEDRRSAESDRRSRPMSLVETKKIPADVATVLPITNIDGGDSSSKQQPSSSSTSSSANALPEKIANHPWILCLTKNEYISSSPSHSQAQHPHPPSPPQQGLLVYPPSAATTSSLLGHHHPPHAGSAAPPFYHTYINSPEDAMHGGRPPPPQPQPHRHPMDRQPLAPLHPHIHHSSQPPPQPSQHHQQPPSPPQPSYQIVSTTRPNSSSSNSSSSARASSDGSGQIEGTGQLSKESNFLDITEYLNMPQTQAAKHIGIPTSTLSKRWREAARQR